MRAPASLEYSGETGAKLFLSRPRNAAIGCLRNSARDWGARDAVIILLLGISLSGPLHAAATPDSAASRRPADAASAPRRDEPLATVIPIPGIGVERERPLSGARRKLPTGFVSDLEAGAGLRAIESLSELLGEAAGVHVDQYGGLGSFSTVSLRGAAAGQVTVYLDGAPLTSAAHGVVSLSDLPITAVERVELYRGLAPLGLGVATPGGAINLVTASKPGPAELRVVRGSFGTWEARGTAGAKRGRVSALFHGGYQGSQGDFEYHDDNGTPYNPDDDSLSARANNRFDAATGLASVQWQPGAGLKLHASEDLFHKAQGVPGVGAITALDTRLELTRSLTHAGIAWAGAGLWPAIEARGSLDLEHTRFQDLEGELGFSYHDTDDRLESREGSLGLRWSGLGSWLGLEGAGSVREERAELHDAADGLPDPPVSRRTTRGAVAGVELRPAGRVLLLRATRRWDRIEDRLASVGVAGILNRSEVTRELDSPQLGARATGPFGLEARGTWAKAARVPTFEELFGRAGSILGDPSLRPERAENWDAGLGWSGEFGGTGRSASGAARPAIRGSVVWAHFESQAEDLIIYERLFGFVRPRNISRALIRGEELSLEAARGGLVASASFTWQSAIDHSPFPFRYGTRLALRPARQAFARLAWRGRTFQVAGSVQYIGDNYLNPGNRSPVASRTIAGASLAVTPFGPGLAFTLEGKNLGDNRIVDVAGYPLPGRSLFLSCAWRGRTRSGDRVPPDTQP